MMNLDKEYKEVLNSFNSMFENAFSREMKTDIMETDKEYILEVEVPGIDKANISISYADDILTVSAKQVKKDKNLTYLAKERASVDLTRTYYLDDADEENITAKMDNGILTITIAKITKKNDKKLITIE